MNNHIEITEKGLDELFVEVILDNMDDDRDELFFIFDDEEFNDTKQSRNQKTITTEIVQ